MLVRGAALLLSGSESEALSREAAEKGGPTRPGKSKKVNRSGLSVGGVPLRGGHKG